MANYSFICGFELGHLGECYAVTGSPLVGGSYKRSGSYGLYGVGSGTASGYVEFRSKAAGGSDRSIFGGYRIYVNLGTLPPFGSPCIIAGAAPSTRIYIDYVGHLSLDGVNWSTSNITPAQGWNKLSLVGDGTIKRILVNGVEFITSAADLIAAQTSMLLGKISSVNYFEAYYDDLLVASDGNENVDFPDGQVILLKPISDLARGTWTAGAGGTSNLWEAINNVPPGGLATETDTSNVKNADSTGNQDATFNCTTYTNGGIGASDTINAVMAVCNDGEHVATNTKAGGVWISNNPTQSAPGQTFDYGDDAGVHDDFQNLWKTHAGPVTSAPSVTKGSSPVVAVRKTTASTRVTCVDHLSVYVDYAPAGAGNLTAAPDDDASVSEYRKPIVSPIAPHLSESGTAAEYRKAVVSPVAPHSGESAGVSEYVRTGIGLGKQVWESITAAIWPKPVVSPLAIHTGDDASNSDWLKRVINPLAPRPYDSIAGTDWSKDLVNPLAIHAADNLGAAEFAKAPASPLAQHLQDAISAAEWLKGLVSPLAVHGAESAAASESLTAELHGIAGLSELAFAAVSVIDAAIASLKTLLFKVSAFESALATEGVKAAINPVAALLFDAASIAETIKRVLNPLAPHISDSVGASEAAERVFLLIRIYADFSDAISGTDWAKGVVGPLAGHFWESTTAAEWTKSLLTPLAPHVGHPIYIREWTKGVVNPLAIHASDGLSASELGKAPCSPLAGHLAEAIAAGEWLKRVMTPLAIHSADSAGAGETATGELKTTAGLTRSISDGLSVVDATVRELRTILYKVSIVENIAAAEGIKAVMTPLARLIFDAAVVSEGVLRALGPIAPHLADPVSVSDAIDRLLKIIRIHGELQETAGTSDWAKVVIGPLALHPWDGAAASEYRKVVLDPLPGHLTDSASAVEWLKGVITPTVFKPWDAIAAAEFTKSVMSPISWHPFDAMTAADWISPELKSVLFALTVNVHEFVYAQTFDN